MTRHDCLDCFTSGVFDNTVVVVVVKASDNKLANTISIRDTSFSVFLGVSLPIGVTEAPASINMMLIVTLTNPAYIGFPFYSSR